MLIKARLGDNGFVNQNLIFNSSLFLFINVAKNHEEIQKPHFGVFQASEGKREASAKCETRTTGGALFPPPPPPVLQAIILIDAVLNCIKFYESPNIHDSKHTLEIYSEFLHLQLWKIVCWLFLQSATIRPSNIS